MEAVSWMLSLMMQILLSDGIFIPVTSACTVSRSSLQLFAVSLLMMVFMSQFVMCTPKKKKDEISVKDISK